MGGKPREIARLSLIFRSDHFVRAGHLTNAKSSLIFTPTSTTGAKKQKGLGDIAGVYTQTRTPIFPTTYCPSFYNQTAMSHLKVFRKKLLNQLPAKCLCSAILKSLHFFGVVFNARTKQRCKLRMVLNPLCCAIISNLPFV